LAFVILLGCSSPDYERHSVGTYRPTGSVRAASVYGNGLVDTSTTTPYIGDVPVGKYWMFNAQNDECLSVHFYRTDVEAGQELVKEDAMAFSCHEAPRLGRIACADVPATRGNTRISTPVVSESAHAQFDLLTVLGKTSVRIPLYTSRAECLLGRAPMFPQNNRR
jgi:hypothetical protein